MCRPNVSEAAQYYSILFLNQIFFRREQDAELAKHVVMFYFEIFKRYIQEAFDPNQEDKKKKRRRKTKKLQNSDEKLSKKKRKELQRLKQEEKIATQNRTRHLSAILTGINRAFPYVVRE